MNKNILYPKNIDNLLKKNELIIQNEQNIEKIDKFIKWKNWFTTQNYNYDYVCKKNEFLKSYCDNNQFSLQIWHHGNKVDSIICNLLTNYYSEYNTELTKVVDI